MLSLQPTKLVIGHDKDPWRDTFPSTLTAEARRQGGMEIHTVGLHAAQWFAAHLRFTGAEWRNQPFIPLPWQVRALAEMFAVNPDTGRLRFGRAFLSTAKKSGKTEMAAAIALFLCAGLDVMDPNIAIAASSEDQASLVFDAAKRMVKNGSLDPISKFRENLIMLRLDHADEANIRRVAAGSGTLDGMRLSGVVFDELHTFHLPKHEETYEILTQSGSLYKDFFILSITTAPPEGESICMKMLDRWEAGVNGEVDDPRFWGCVFRSRLDRSVDDEEGWLEANPSLGEIGSAEKIRTELLPEKSESYMRRYFLNQVFEADDAWEAVKVWPDLAGVPKLSEDRPTWCGVDLAMKEDTTAVVVVQWDPEEERFHMVHKLWTNPYPPSDARREEWRTPLSEVMKFITDLHEKYPVASVQEESRQGGKRHQGMAVVYDPFKMQLIAEDLEGRGVTMLDWPQEPKRMQVSAMTLEQTIMAGEIVHDGDAQFAHQMRNVRREENRDMNRWRMVRRTGASKEKTQIDGPIALAMAVAAAKVQINNGILEPRRAPQIRWL